MLSFYPVIKPFVNQHIYRPVAGELDEIRKVVMANNIVAGDMYRDIDGQLFEIKRQLRQPGGYPFDPELLKFGLQQMIEGRFVAGVDEKTIPHMPSTFKVENTNLSEAIANCERFSKEILGITVDLREQFNMPTELPRENVLVIYDPGLNNREAVEKALKSQKKIKKVYEETDVMNYDGSRANGKPTLQIIANSITPEADTLGDNAKSPDQLVADGRNYLRLRGYALAFGQRHFLHGDYLDPKTWTWFPKDRLPSGKVAFGCWFPGPDDRKVGFCWFRSGSCDPDYGARLAIPVSLKT